jgi:hypothetical protein
MVFRGLAHLAVCKIAIFEENFSLLDGDSSFSSSFDSYN